MEEKNEAEPGPGQKRVWSVLSFFVTFFYWINLFGFLDLFFGIVLPDLGRSDFGHYLEFAVILAIMASVGESLRKRKSAPFFLGLTTLLFVVNIYAVWRNWFYH
jgi:hypothetical protein